MIAGLVPNAGARTHTCATCLHFRADPFTIEQFVPGLRSFGSGFAAVRGDDGLCLRHGRYLAATSSCADYAPHASAPQATVV